MGVVDAEGLDDGAVGEDRTEGTRTNGTSNNDTKEQDGCFTLKMTRTLFHLEPLSVVCPHWKCADDAPWCSHEKKCACARVTFIENLRLFLWMLDSVWMGYSLLIFGTL